MRVGLALGGGGVRGLAHVLALEVLDDLGIRPTRISGTSMGAIVGSLYASGKSGREIREGIHQHIIARGEGIKEMFNKRHELVKWLSAIQLTRRSGGILKADGFFAFLFDELKVDTFEELAIPFAAVAADFYRGDAVVMESGDLMSAVQASMSIPGVFAPVTRGGRVLVDGGVVNNLPYDILAEDCDVTIALDVAPSRDPDCERAPNIVDATLGMFDILVDRVTEAMLAERPPSVYCRPEISGIRVLDFDRIEDVYAQAQPAMDIFRRELDEVMG